MRKVYKELTPDQKARGVIFSSELVGGGKVHEVFAHGEDCDKLSNSVKIKRLLDDSFFNDSPYKYNLIRQ